ncbi:MAG TPA: hypothetical protein VIW46_04745 [Acidimicrobiia bacterium]
MDLAIPLLIVAAVLFGVGMLLRRAREKDPRAAETQAKKSGRGSKIEPEVPQLDLSGPRPNVVGMHVSGTEAQVTFDVPLPEGDDTVLSELLIGEAVEVLRERRHTVPISSIDTVVAFAGRPMPSEVGRVSLPAAGELPDASATPSMLSLSSIAEDPLSADIDWSARDTGGGAVVSRGDDLGPIARELKLPKAIDTGLRAQGIDPATMSAAQLVTGTLSLIGYSVVEGPIDGTWYATKGDSRTFIREIPHSAGDHPELDDGEVSRFLFEFQSAGADRGLLVTDKFGPFSVYDKERREPRVRFVTRERLQRVVDSMALG